LPLLLLPSAAALDELAAADVELAAFWPVLASVGVADVSVTITVMMPVFWFPPFSAADAVMIDVTRMVDGALVLPVTVAIDGPAVVDGGPFAAVVGVEGITGAAADEAD